MATSAIDTSLYPQAMFIPWTWSVSSSTPNPSCPSARHVLGTFAATNAVVALCNLVTGHRLMLEFLCCRPRRGRSLNYWFVLTFLFPLGLKLLANAAIAALYHGAPGYGESFKIADLALFYTTRPRFGWLVLALLLRFGRERDKKGVWNNGEYGAAAKGIILAELCMLLFGSYYMGITAHFGATHGYYKLGALAGPYASSAGAMYAGALLFLVSLPFALISCVRLLHDDGKHQYLRKLEVAAIVGMAVTSLVGSWLFWGGYVFLARELYCPPSFTELIASGIIWASLSAIGTVFGGAN